MAKRASARVQREATGNTAGKLMGLAVGVKRDLFHGSCGHKVQRDRTKYSRKGKSGKGWI